VGFEGFSSTPGEFAAFMKTQLRVWEKMVKDADIVTGIHCPLLAAYRTTEKAARKPRGKRPIDAKP
jgi:hypothetical protein